MPTFNEDVIVTTSNGEQQTVRLDGDRGRIRGGGNGTAGDVALYTTDGNTADAGAATVLLDGQRGRIRAGGNGTAGDVALYTTDGNTADAGAATVLLDGQRGRIRAGGNGTDGDIAIFSTQGDVTDPSSAAIMLDGRTGDILLQNADCAEEFEVGAESEVRPGSVVSMTNDGRVQECSMPYDKRVIGVVSGAGSHRPAIVMDHQVCDLVRVPVALLGKVYCRVDAEYGAIEIGDLLSTSPTTGHAMKAAETNIPLGVIIGKALQPLAAGTGLILTLVAR